MGWGLPAIGITSAPIIYHLPGLVNVFINIFCGYHLPYAIDPMAGLDLTFTADTGYFVGSGTYCLDNDTKILLGFSGKNTYEQVSVREETGFVGDVTVYPEFVPIVGEGQFGITAGDFANATITLTQTIDGETTSYILEPDEIYALDADTDVTITIQPAANYTVGSYSYIYVGSSWQWIRVNGEVGEPVTLTVKVSGDINLHLVLEMSNNPPWYAKLYAVDVVDSKEGMVIRDHVTAYEGETVTLTIKPSTGWEVDAVIVESYTGQTITARYRGINQANNGRVYTFTMPKESVKVTVTYKPAK